MHFVRYCRGFYLVIPAQGVSCANDDPSLYYYGKKERLLWTMPSNQLLSILHLFHEVVYKSMFTNQVYY